MCHLVDAFLYKLKTVVAIYAILERKLVLSDGSILIIVKNKKKILINRKELTFSFEFGIVTKSPAS